MSGLDGGPFVARIDYEAGLNILAAVTNDRSPLRVAVVGAGIAGASCARALALAGCAVHVVDKARGAGGRLATKRLEWLDAQGRRRIASFDHGAPAFAVGDAGFRGFLDSAIGPEGLVPWTPTPAAGGRELVDAGPLCLPLPDMRSLCGGLLRGVATTWNCAVDRLQRGPRGWQVGSADATLPGPFDAVLLALPPAQAAPLLAPHRRDWAQRASLALMQPCWTLMGVARCPDRERQWDVARPEQGPLACVIRHDARPGRASSPDEAHWVAHARAGWSRQHLEQPAAWVQAALQAALRAVLGEPIEWQHAVVHRWRYAMPQPSGSGPVRRCWWDGARGLGVCGDFLGGSGVEGAWQSAQALVDAVSLERPSTATPAPSRAGRPLQPAAA